MSRKLYQCPHNPGVGCTHKPTPESCEKCGWRPGVASKRIITRIEPVAAPSLEEEIACRDRQIERLMKVNSQLSKRCERLREMLNKALEVEDETD